MRKRYVAVPRQRPVAHTAPRSWMDDFYPANRMSMDIEEDVLAPIKTGLLDEMGNPIWAFPSREPIGFYRVPDEDEEF